MKRASSVVTVAVLAVAGLLAGCSGDNNTAGPTDDPLVSQLVDLGFRRDMIVDRGSYFLVEGDIEIPKASVADLAHSQKGIKPDFQWRTPTIVAPDKIRNITINLAGLASQPAWQTAARQAIVEWNKVNCADVRLTEASPGQITVSTYTDASNVAAVGSFPLSSGFPGQTIKINTAYTGSPNTAATKKRNMAHEIGHNIGFRHTNWQSGGEPQLGAVLIPGTPATDGASVMNGGTATTGWTAFSYYDAVATKTMYPGLCPNLRGPSQVWPYYTCSWTAAATGGTPPYQYAWPGFGFSSATTYLYHNSGGGFSISVTVRDATGKTSVQSMGVTVYQYGPSCG
jgi:dual-action HEIGH metallo-peptidase